MISRLVRPSDLRPFPMTFQTPIERREHRAKLPTGQRDPCDLQIRGFDLVELLRFLSPVLFPILIGDSPTEVPMEPFPCTFTGGP